MNHPLSVALCVSVTAFACQSSSSPTPERAAKLSQARDLLAAQQFDDALLITDDLLDQDRSDRDALLLAAAGSEALADAGRSGAASLLTDAANSLQRVVELQPQDAETWLKLAQVHRKTSAFEKGRDAALQAAEVFRSRNASQDVYRAALAAADNEMQLFVAARQPEFAAGKPPEPSTVERANALLARLEFTKQGLPGAAYPRIAQTYQWLNQDVRALDELERGIEAAPQEAAIHEAFQDAHARLDKRAACVAAYQRLVERSPQQPLLQWFLGRAHVLAADKQRSQGAFDEAAAGYARAHETFLRYRAQVPSHAAATAEWLAICSLSRGRVALESGDLDTARKHYEAAYDATPAVAENNAEGAPKIVDSFGGNYLGGLDRIGRALADAGDEAALTQALAHYERLLQRHPNQFGQMYNNAAFTARELGAKIAESAEEPGSDATAAKAREQRAQQTWERSYELYCKAVELEPNDPRIVNDCGLMLIYHLHREEARARQLFDRAIELGTQQLADLPDDASTDQRNFLEEAVGDAYENIAVQLLNQGKPFAEYKPFLENSVKYWRYQQRRAAVILASEGKVTGPMPGQTRATNAGTPATPVTAPTSQDPKQAAAFETAKKAADAQASNGDLDGALAVLDGVASQLRGFAPFHQLVGSYSLRYANQAAKDGGKASQIDGLFADAVRQFQLAIEADGKALQPHLDLAQALYDRGSFADAGAAADDAHSRLSAQASPTQTATTHWLRAAAWTRVFVGKKQANESDEEALRRARASFKALEQHNQLKHEQLVLWSSLEQWAGAPQQALDVLVRALPKAANNEQLLATIIDTASSVGGADRVVAALADRSDATGLWFRGRASFALGQEQWSGGEFANAVTTLERAIADFGAAKAKNPDFADSSNQWTALSLGSKGLALLSQDKLDDAEAALLEAARQSPAQAGVDLGGGNSIKRGILIVADRFRETDMGRTERIFRAATEAVPADADFANNHGLFARDHGVAIERQGKTAEAMALYEGSYASYTRAAALEPGSVRLANDRALILIYHLKRDFDLARDLLTDAIERGQAQLDSDPPQDKDALQSLQEAVGDCWQNLGYYQETAIKDLAAAKASYEKSLTYFPFRIRAAAGNLRRVQRQLDKAAGSDATDKDGEGAKKDG